MNYEFIIDLRSYKDFEREYFDISKNINEHKQLHAFYIPTKDEFFNNYHSFWAKYEQSEEYKTNITNAIVYKLKTGILKG